MIEQPSSVVEIAVTPVYGSAKTRLIEMAKKVNLAEDMNEEELQKIGSQVVDDYEIDEESRKEWIDRNKEAIKLANQIREEKSFPWQGAANVKLPMIADAAIKFAARAYAEIIKGNRVVQGSVVGPDPGEMKAQRADRVGKFMSWQLLEGMPEWECDTDKLLHVLPVIGHVFRKVYYNSAKKRTCSQMVMPEDFCVNNKAQSLEDARRGTHILRAVPKNTIIENQRSGAWLDFDIAKMLSTSEVDGEPEDSRYYDFLEQHTWRDLDGDGYEEPYCITVEKESRTVTRIVARYEADGILENAKGQIQRIDPSLYFADYKFLPSFDGGYYHVGFGTLLSPLNETANTIFNQLLDAGTMSNLGGGFLSKEIKVTSGIYRFTPNEWKKTSATAEQLDRGVKPLPVREPSSVLFSLLSLVMELTKDLASVKDVLAGDAPGANVPATTVMALIEQGQKTYNAIYKRIYRSLKNEFGILFRLNSEYLDEEEYYKVLDQDAKVYREDFNRKDLDVIPVADPALSTDVQRMAKAQALGEMATSVPNPIPIIKYKLEMMQVDPQMIEEIMTPQQGAPDPEMIKMQHEAAMKQADTMLKEAEQNLKEKMAEYDAMLKEAQAALAFAQANSIPVQQQNVALKTLVDSAHRQIDQDLKQSDQPTQQAPTDLPTT